MTVSRAFFACLAILVLGGSLHAETYVEPKTGIEFPETVGDFKRLEVKPYRLQSGAEGVSVGYEADKVAVTLYVRTLESPAKGAEVYVQDSLAEVKIAEERGIYAEVKEMPAPALSGSTGWSAGAFTASQAGMPFVSYVLCKVSGQSLLKIRCSSPTREEKELLGICEKFQAVLDKGK